MTGIVKSKRAKLPSVRKLQIKTDQGDSRPLVHRQGKMINGKMMIIEVRTDRKTMLIMAYCVEEPEKFSLTLSYGEGLEVMGMAEDYKLLVHLVSLEDRDLVLRSRV